MKKAILIIVSLNGESQSVSYGYDEIGRLVKRTYGTEANPSAFSENQTYNIFDDLIKTEIKVDGGAEASSHTSKTRINDIFKVFKFASGKTKVEWAVHRNGDTYTIGTGHNSYSASSWEDYTKDKPNATVHSHPDIGSIVSGETFSMGYDSPYKKTDWNNVRIDVEQTREKV